MCWMLAYNFNDLYKISFKLLNLSIGEDTVWTAKLSITHQHRNSYELDNDILPIIEE